MTGLVDRVRALFRARPERCPNCQSVVSEEATPAFPYCSDACCEEWLRVTAW